jgi:hypothetical protein
MSRLYFFIIVMVLIFTGCSQTSTPILPDNSQSENLPGVANIDENSYLRDELTFGVWEINVDLATLKSDTFMVRSAGAIGQTIPDALLSTYLTVTPCSTCMRMDVIGYHPDTGQIDLNIGIRHPLAAFNAGLPITAANRADLDVFDVMGIIILPKIDDVAFNYMIDGTRQVEVDPFTMVNPDGYTTSLNDVITDPSFLNPPWIEPLSTLNPFKSYFTSTQNRRFIQGEPFQTVTYTFDTRKISDVLRFYIAFRASYGVSASFARTISDPWGVGSRANPKYYVPEFNQIEAYDVVVGQTGNLAWGDIGSTAQITVQCKDFQAGLTGLGRFIMEIDPQDAISFTSDVTRVVADIPAISNTIFQSTTPVSGSGIEGDPYQFEMIIQNNNAALFGTYPYLVVVEDSRSYQPIHAYQIGQLRIPYIDDFDPFDDSIGWQVHTFRGLGWSIVNNAGDNFWDESNGSNYGDEDSTRLTSPVIDLTYSSAHPFLEITHNYVTQYRWDGGSVFLSLDGGTTFDYLEPIPVLSGKAYDSTILGNTLPDTLLSGKWGFTGNSEGNQVTQFDLTKAAYHANVCVQFVFEADQYTSGNGWEIRNIKIQP